MLGENGWPETPDWQPESRLEPDFSKPVVKPACQLCRQQLDGRGNE